MVLKNELGPFTNLFCFFQMVKWDRMYSHNCWGNVWFLVLLVTKLIFISEFVCEKVNWWLFQFYYSNNTDSSWWELYSEGCLKMKKRCKSGQILATFFKWARWGGESRLWGVSGIPFNQLCLWPFLWEFSFKLALRPSRSRPEDCIPSHRLSGVSSPRALPGLVLAIGWRLRSVRA